MRRQLFTSRYSTVAEANAPMHELDPLDNPNFRRLGFIGDLSFDEIYDLVLEKFADEVDPRNGTPYLYLMSTEQPKNHCSTRHIRKI